MFYMFRRSKNPEIPIFSGFLLGVLVRFIGSFGAFYWEFWCDLMGLLVRFFIVDNSLLGALVRLFKHWEITIDYRLPIVYNSR